jgi:hypothetical protein
MPTKGDLMSLYKVYILVCLLIVGFVLTHIYLVGIETDKAYAQGYDDGMVSISPDYCLKEFSGNDAPKFRYIKRQYCKGTSK